MKLFRTYGFIALLFCPHHAHGAPDSTTIELFVDRAEHPFTGPEITVPHDAALIRFAVDPKSLLVRYKLEGLDQDWHLRTDEMFFMVRFLNANGDQILQESFPASGRSEGWNGNVTNSLFTPRREVVTVPPDAEYLSVAMSSAGPASVVGVIAVSEINITSIDDQGNPGRTFLSDSRAAGANSPLWIKSGTHPSMAYDLHLDVDDGTSPVLVIEDDDITAHADWATAIYSLPKITPGETLEVRWKEAYSNGSGGSFSTSYERLPPGAYRFVVQDVTITGDPLNSVASVSVTVPRPYWKSFWFWGICIATTAVLSTVIGRHLIRRRIALHLQQAQLIADERLRIARDLHDDLGTRLSHIALLGSYAENKIHDDDARATFGQITAMSRELISALSETVWMLNPKNNDLEALVDFLCRLVSDLCRLKEIRCRIDAMSVSKKRTISHEFRHNVSLSVKEAVNNSLKHSFAKEIKMTIRLDGNILKITITDDGVGISGDSGKTGIGLDNLVQRMASIRGKCVFDELNEGGLRVTLEAPII